MDDRFFHVGHDPDLSSWDAGNNIECCLLEDGTITFHIENPWAGSTEEGFGQTTSHNISKKQAKELAEWLMKVAS